MLRFLQVAASGGAGVFGSQHIGSSDLYINSDDIERRSGSLTILPLYLTIHRLFQSFLLVRYGRCLKQPSNVARGARSERERRGGSTISPLGLRPPSVLYSHWQLALPSGEVVSEHFSIFMIPTQRQVSTFSAFTDGSISKAFSRDLFFPESSHRV